MSGWALLRAMRPHQWVKNGFVLIPVVFAQALTEWSLMQRALGALGCFCAISSAVYLLNDSLDYEADRLHPSKRLRPIASGQLSIRTALSTALVLALLTLGLAYVLRPLLAMVIACYALLNVAYTTRLKRIAYVDVLCIALGFELRVFGGAVATGIDTTAALYGITLLLSLFLGFGKRLHEVMQGEHSKHQRQVLRFYSPKILQTLLLLCALATLGCYLLTTLSKETRQALGTDYLAVTVLPASYGMLRFAKLVMRRSPVSPTDQMLRDTPFLANLCLWSACVFLLVYLQV